MKDTKISKFSRDRDKLKEKPFYPDIRTKTYETLPRNQVK